MRINLYLPSNFVSAVLLTLVISLQMGTLIATAQNANSEANEPIKARFHFRNAKATDVMLALGEIYGIQFIGAADVTGNITLVSEEEIDANKALTLLDTALVGLNKSVVMQGGVAQIITRHRAPTRVEIIRLKHADPHTVTQIIAQLFKTRDLIAEANIENQQLIAQLLPKLNEEGSQLLNGNAQVIAMPYRQLNAVIVRAPEAMMPQIKAFIETELDQALPQAPPAPTPPSAPAAPEISKTYHLKFVSADYLANSAKRLLNFSLLIEPRVNAVIFKSTSPEHFNALEDLIAMLDVPDAQTDQIFHVVLRNAVANNVQQVLQRVYASTYAAPFTTQSLDELNNTQPTNDAVNELTQAGITPALAEELAANQLKLPVGAVDIVADDANNALLIRTNPSNIDAILDIIQELDRVRGQVMISVFIAEVRLDNTLELGADFIYSGASGEGRYTIGQDFNLRNTATTGLSYSLVSDNITAFLRALQSSTKLDVISRPQILTLDNQPALIEFGQRVPLVQTTQVTSEGTVNSTVRYEDVTTRLSVTPHINEAGFVRMDIKQDIDDISQDTFSISEQLAPNILVTRRAQTSVQIRDGQTVCFGGFITDTIDEAEDKTPILGDIPYVGLPFKSMRKTRVKNELLIFITPYILNTPEQLLANTNQRRIQATVVGRPDRDIGDIQIKTEPSEYPQDQPLTRKRYQLPETQSEQTTTTDLLQSPTEIPDEKPVE